MTITVVIATYNRCPEPVVEDNPLTWCIASLLVSDVDDVVVVDDGSTDHTPDVLAELVRRSGQVVRAHRLPEHQGMSAARNAGFRSAEGDQVLILDDDCLAGPAFLATARGGWAAAAALDPTVGVLTLPYYTRARHPRGSKPAPEIGHLDLDRGYFASNFDCLPAGRSPAAPLPTSMVSGVCVFDRALLDDIGGYPDLRRWRTAFSDHLEVSARLAGTGRHAWHLPDPAAAAIHLKFGASGCYPPLGRDDADWHVPGPGRRLGELVALAERPRRDTGSRVADAVGMEEMIGSFFACYARYSTTGGRQWATRVHHDYVLGCRSYTAAYRAAASRDERRVHWRRGLARGMRDALDRGGPAVADQVRNQALAACADVAEEPLSER